MREAESDLFHQTGLEQWFPSLTTRYELPRLFAELEEFDLAARLFRKYNEGIVSYRWNHQTFLEHFAGFLIDQKEFVEAESILKRAFRKSIRVDLRLFPRLYQEWGKLDTLEDEISDLYLSEGRRALLRDWRTALAEGREMVEYSDTW
jgi:tetratricopeptide (TPR) repeat protein